VPAEVPVNVYHSGVFTKLNKMVFPSQTQLLLLYLMYYSGLSVYHHGVFTKLSEMFFTSQTHILLLYLMYYLGPNSTLSTIIKGVFDW